MACTDLVAFEIRGQLVPEVGIRRVTREMKRGKFGDGRNFAGTEGKLAGSLPGVFGCGSRRAPSMLLPKVCLIMRLIEN